MTARRWRPSLAFVLMGALAATLALSFAGLVALRYLGPAIGFRPAAALLALGIVAATAVLGWLLIRLLLRPIRALEAYATATASGLAPDPPRHFGTRELHRTAVATIGMAETLRDRAATVKGFTDHVTHELRTPVAAIRAAVELLQDAGPSPGDARLLAQIDGARAQLEVQLSALRDIARAREARYLGTCTLNGVTLPEGPLHVSGGDVPLPLSAEGMALVLGHLIRNAADHGTSRIDLCAEPGPVLTVTDDGPGISPGNAARVFDPFFTTRREGGGTGMGLAIVRGILSAHRATIDLAPAEPGRGARFVIRFPG